jgi:hypothetical protein
VLDRVERSWEFAEASCIASTDAYVRFKYKNSIVGSKHTLNHHLGCWAVRDRKGGDLSPVEFDTIYRTAGLNRPRTDIVRSFRSYAEAYMVACVLSTILSMIEPNSGTLAQPARCILHNHPEAPIFRC